MDESEPPIPPGEFRLRSASERTSAGIDPARPELTNSSELAAVEPQSRSGQIEVCRNEPCDGVSVAVYCRNEEEVRKGFLIALHAMGVAVIEQLPEPAKPPVGAQSHEDVPSAMPQDHSCSYAFPQGSE